MLLISLIAGSY